jgi:NhaA family Na+:H+ antiporter
LAGHKNQHAPYREVLPKQPIRQWLSPIESFLFLQSTSGLLLVVITAIALFLANTDFVPGFLKFWHLPCQVRIGDWKLEKDLLHVINDGLMAVFFFVVGLEIKREIVVGELRDPRTAALPVIAAIGGMLVPALVFVVCSLILNVPGEASRGWAIPMATDIAFVVGLLALFGNRVPLGLKILLLSLAIVDDLGAVLLIAFVFTESLSFELLGWALGGLLFIYGMNRAGVRAVPIYVVVGGLIWLAVLKAGVHPTVAGVLLGLMTPASAWVNRETLNGVLGQLREELDRLPDDPTTLHDELAAVEFATRESVPPLYRLEHLLHPWVALAIMPVFALANAGVPIRMSYMSDPVTQSIACGLLVGKPLGIGLFSFAAVKLGLARLPTGVNWTMLMGGGWLAGIGFTMSLFLTGLALPDSHIDAGKLGTLLGSVLSTILGMSILTYAIVMGGGHETTSDSAK